MRIGLGPSNNLSTEISPHSADVAVFSHAVRLCAVTRAVIILIWLPHVTHGYYITAYNRLTWYCKRRIENLREVVPFVISYPGVPQVLNIY